MGKPAKWYWNALKRTVATAFPAGIRPDDDWARGVLTNTEFQVYCTMPKVERSHGVHVAKSVVKHCPTADRALIAAAILHDVGKVDSPQLWAYRVLVHLYPGEKQPYDSELTGLAAARQALHHHPERGAQLLTSRGVEKRVVALVREHHDPKSTLAGMDILRLSDEEH